jgi:hypothetical protein
LVHEDNFLAGTDVFVSIRRNFIGGDGDYYHKYAKGEDLLDVSRERD